MHHRDTETRRDVVSVETNRISGAIVNCAFAVHQNLGPGLLESVYETCLHYELTTNGFKVDRQIALPVTYKELSLDTGLRLDLIVNDCVCVELKSVERVLPIHKAQMLTYLKLSGLRVGLLINFNVPLIKDGITRVVL